jgi:pimeloyl-ACP methyl ester carboxylesterase
VELAALEAHRRTFTAKRGSMSYLDIGEGPAALFVHGVFMNGLLWRKALAALSPTRRCIAVDLPAHGHSAVGDEQDLSLPASADLLAALCAQLDLDTVDLIGNDTGGALCQIFAARHEELVRTLTLTNCDAHDNLPPAAFALGKRLAEENQLAPLVMELGKSVELARGNPGLAMGYKHPELLPDEIVLAYMGPFADPERARQLERFVNSTKVEDLLAAEPELEQLRKPTLIVWGTEDSFFELHWAHWLAEHIPGVTQIVEVDGGGLFFCDEHSEELIAALRAFLDQHSPAGALASEAPTPVRDTQRLDSTTRP